MGLPNKILEDRPSKWMPAKKLVLGEKKKIKAKLTSILITLEDELK